MVLQQTSGGGVVAMGMGDEQVGHRAAVDCGHERINVRILGRPWVNNCHPLITDDVGAGTGEGEFAGVLTRDPLHEPRHLVDGTVGDFVVKVELRSCSHRLRLVPTACAASNQRH